MKINLLKQIAHKPFINGLTKSNKLAKDLVYKEKIINVLDVGCGNGENTIKFTKSLRPKEIYGIEYVDEFRRQAERKGIKCVKGDLNEKWRLKNDYFDLILSNQSIEHIHNTRLFLEEAYRCLKPKGQLIIQTENLSSFINIGALIFGWQPFSTTNINGWSLGNPLIWHVGESNFKGYLDENFLERYQNTGISGAVGHVRVLAYAGLKDLLKRVGFKKIKVYTRGYLPFSGKLSDLLCFLDNRHGHFLIASAEK